MLKPTTKTEVVNALLTAVETQYQLIAKELADARQALEEKDNKRNFYGLIGSIVSTPERLADMQNTMKTLIAMAREPELE